MSQSSWIKQWSPRRVALATLIVVAIGFGFFLLYRFLDVVLLFFIAIILGTAVRPAVEWLYWRGFRRIYAEIIIYFLLFIALVAFLVLLAPLILNQITEIFGQLSGYYEETHSFLVNSEFSLLRQIAEGLPPEFDLEEIFFDALGGVEIGPSVGVEAVSQTLRLLTAVFGGIFSVIVILLMSFYWVLEGDRAIRSLTLLVAEPTRSNLRELIDAIEKRLEGFLSGELLLMVVVGALSLIAYLVIGLPSALVLAIFAGLFEAIPNIGPILGTIPAALVALVVDPALVIWVFVAQTAIQLIENNLLVPRIMGREVGVNPLMTLLFLLTLSSLLGLPGAILAVPLAAIFQLLLERYVIRKEEAPVVGEERGKKITEEERKRLDKLQQEAGDLVEEFRVQRKSYKEDEPLRQILSKLERLVLDFRNLLDKSIKGEEISS